MAKQSGDDRFLTRRELKHLPELLLDDEQVISFASGIMDGNSWLIALTDMRIIFINKKFLWGMEFTSINLNQINAITGRTGIVMGAIAIEDGASTRTIKNVLKRCVNPFVQSANQALFALRQPRGA
ncbi:hypothetical protein BJI67_16255 (plasmid) [Acidihalobacter aeolianus]|uniref:YokE-like PH domain-containing protein n=1 Tax=Acidihalobacter aeolianus TaxID=2792603 RepID=A0A1D8KD19_9GAMM|nr:hypothetical protein BJI67_16255 [Acidihalobacter aeolianus]